MYTIQIVVRCSDVHAEVYPDTPESVACLIEESISLLLVQLFDVVLVDTVNVVYSSSEDARGNLLSPAV